LSRVRKAGRLKTSAVAAPPQSVTVFAKRHERELAEVHTLTVELDRRVGETLEQLERIRKTQDQLSGRKAKRSGRLKAETDSPPEGNRAHPLIVFVHIPKTAGGTVLSMFAAAYSKREVRDAGNWLRTPERPLSGYANPRKISGRVLAGHVPYGCLRQQLPPGTQCLTFLREPVDRVLSHYYRHIQRNDPSRAGTPKALANPSPKANSLDEALVEMRLPHITNLATRFLSGHPSPLGDLPPSALEDAKANLRGFAFIGIQERFEESLVLLQRLLGLGEVPYQDRHVNADRPSVEELPDEQRALIVEHNQLDLELYRFGLELADEAIAAAGPGFAADVEALRARDATAREEDWRAAALAS
jgi:hypothetical protein